MPIDTLSLFVPLDELLFGFLADLSREDWQRPTIAGTWTVRDVAAHLLDTPLRRLSFVRDGWPPAGVRIASDADLVAFVNALNADGVRVYGRLSPQVLIDMLRLVLPQLVAHLSAAPPDAPAAFPVSWAGEVASFHWFDVAREYTERWHHQAQIRMAVGEAHLAPLLTARFYTPVIATFVRALPHACRDVEADEGAVAHVVVEGEGGGAWMLRRTAQGWHLVEDPIGDGKRPAATVHIPADLAWRLFTKGASREDVAARCRWQGDPGLAQAMLAARAIVG